MVSHPYGKHFDLVASEGMEEDRVCSGFPLSLYELPEAGAIFRCESLVSIG
jgi:hypothetical protein